MKVILRTNDINIQKKHGALIKHGVRVFIEHVGGLHSNAKFVISFERKLAPDLWGDKFSFEKQVSKQMVEDAFVKTIEHLYQNEIINNLNYKNQNI